VAQKSNFHCDIRASFASAFGNWRRKNNIPLKKIARDLGLAVSTINSWELGERFPTGRNFEMLANYTGVPPCRLTHQPEIKRMERAGARNFALHG